jgi:hypothetical protein
MGSYLLRIMYSATRKKWDKNIKHVTGLRISELSEPVINIFDTSVPPTPHLPSKHEDTTASTLSWSGSSSALKEQTSRCSHLSGIALQCSWTSLMHLAYIPAVFQKPPWH